MKKEMDLALVGEIKIDSLADIAEVALQQDQFALAIKYAEQGLELILPMHAQKVRFYCILMRAHNGLDMEANGSLNGSLHASLLTSDDEREEGRDTGEDTCMTSEEVSRHAAACSWPDV